MRLLVLGATGMLGHRLVAELAPRFDVAAASRGRPEAAPAALAGSRQIGARWIGGLDATDEAMLTDVLDRERPDVVLNAAGVVKQRLGSGDVERAVAVNALLPHRLARLCRGRGLRLIHFSTDCVFAGRPGDRRGADGYREDDPAEPADVYGRSKLLGEPTGAGCLVLRTSLVGRELGSRHGLVEWFLAQGDGPVAGYTGALFTGVTTAVVARLVGELVDRHPRLDGTWHVAAAPIAKHDLLRLLGAAFRRPTEVRADDAVRCDRRLDGSRFRAATGWIAPSWERMIADLATHG
ncbi:dTDP-4-dehydrorhamnose reductase family protein [Stella sp.]|uniref:dTDP-4-dehydrorhamnose reductase family protein n=1 Tax=Stella sp. TaxID=2912054 RepID=UPI0035B1EC1B